MIDWNRVCPFCGSVMIGTNGHPICHSNPDCVIHDESIPQELLDKLEATRKALEAAVDALKELYQATHYDKNNYVGKVCSNTLEQIESITKGDK